MRARQVLLPTLIASAVAIALLWLLAPSISRRARPYGERERLMTASCARSAVDEIRESLNRAGSVTNAIAEVMASQVGAPCEFKNPFDDSPIWFNPRVEDWKVGDADSASPAESGPIVACVLITFPKGERHWGTVTYKGYFAMRPDAAAPGVDWWDSRLSWESTRTASGTAPCDHALTSPR
jgi:hypothetical protein